MSPVHRIAPVAPFYSSGRSNGPGDMITPEQVGRLWNPADRGRLLAIRDRVDPTGLFATNIHIG